MNSERRHELQHNLLADVLGQWGRAIEPYTKLIAVIVAAVAVALVAWGLVQNNATMARSDATLELLQNANGSDAEALAAVADRYGNTAAGLMAQLFQADANLGSGIAVLYSDREEAEAKINDAAAAYAEIAKNANEKFLVSRANFGLGRAMESLGKIEDATKAYQQVVNVRESAAIADAAQARIDLLKKPETQEFLTWFTKQDFKPVDPSVPPALPGTGALPDLPDLNLPPLDLPEGSESKDAEGAASAPGAMMLPATDASTAATPAADAPANKTDEPPAEPAKPADSAPAEMPQPASAPATESPATETPATETPATGAAAETSKPEDAAAAATTPSLDNPTVRVTDEK